MCDLEVYSGRDVGSPSSESSEPELSGALRIVWSSSSSKTSSSTDGGSEGEGIAPGEKVLLVAVRGAGSGSVVSSVRNVGRFGVDLD